MQDSGMQDIGCHLPASCGMHPGSIQHRVSSNEPPGSSINSMTTTTTDSSGAHWVRMRFKRNKVWVEADPQGRPRLSGGRARIKYQLEQDQDYRVRAENLRSLDAAAPEAVSPKVSGPGRAAAADPRD